MTAQNILAASASRYLSSTVGVPWSKQALEAFFKKTIEIDPVTNR